MQAYPFKDGAPTPLAAHIPGLDPAGVRERMLRGQRNHLAIRPTRTYAQIIWGNVFSLYNVVLLGAFLALLLIHGPGASIFPAAIVLVNSAVGVVQEIRAKRALDRLAAISVPVAVVRREGRSLTISVEDIVQDDVVELRPGDSIVVDGRVLASEGLEVDESQLTGESEYVLKQVGDPVTSASFCTSGIGLMLAERVGDDSYVNRLAQGARAYKNVRTPLEQQLDHLVKILVVVMLILAPLTLLQGSLRAVPLAENLENVVNLISSLVPQGLLVFVAISFAHGVLKISRLRALIQRPNAVELMGHITAICADKTGTLTRNVLSVREIIPVGGADLRTVSGELATLAAGASWQNRTLAAIASAVGSPPQQLSRQAEVPFNSERKWSSVSFTSGQTLVLGAPDTLLSDAGLLSESRRLGRQGLRVLAFGAAERDPEPGIPLQPPSLDCEALIALEDQLRPDSAATLEEFARQGIAVKIVSGDSPETVRALAQQAGMDAGIVLAGPDLEQMDATARQDAVRRTSLFARVSPETKCEIVDLLAARGPVAMIGDGVNDVPALKRASLAIAMSDGAPIARDVSDIILLDNAFSILPRAFFEGREITQRLYGIAKISLVKLVYLTMLFVLASYAGLPWPLNLIQTTWLSLVTLTAPAMLIIFRLLPVPRAENRPGEVLRYILGWGVIGSVALLILYVAVLIILREPLESGHAALLGFAGLFNSLVFWDIYRISPLAPRSLLSAPGPASTGLALGLISALIPPYLIADTLAVGRLSPPDLALLILLLVASRLAVSYLRLGHEVDDRPELHPSSGR